MDNDTADSFKILEPLVERHAGWMQVVEDHVTNKHPDMAAILGNCCLSSIIAQAYPGGCFAFALRLRLMARQ